MHDAKVSCQQDAMSTRAERRMLQEAQRQAKALSKLSSQATHVLLVRHGETDWNKEHRLQGQSTLVPGLNDAGKRQAHALQRHFEAQVAQGLKVDAVYSSDLTRAVETADFIALPTQLQVQRTQQLRERHLGDLQGLTTAEAAAAAPEALSALTQQTAHPTMPIPGGGESLAQLQLRAAKALLELAEAHPGQCLVVVTHGGVLTAFHAHVMGRYPSGPVLNASISHVMIEGSTSVITSWNDVRHLAGSELDVDGFGGGAEG